jgi:hypothetical protein
MIYCILSLFKFMFIVPIYTPLTRLCGLPILSEALYVVESSNIQNENIFLCNESTELNKSSCVLRYVLHSSGKFHSTPRSCSFYNFYKSFISCTTQCIPQYSSHSSNNAEWTAVRGSCYILNFVRKLAEFWLLLVFANSSVLN